MKLGNSKTDWNRVQQEAASDASVIYDPETEPYDPNDANAVEAYWETATITRKGRPPAAIKRPTLNMRIDADTLDHLRGLGRGWQTKVNQLLREAMDNGQWPHLIAATHRPCTRRWKA